MLRRGGQRGLQRLPCLIEWAEARVSCGAGAQQHQQRWASSSSEVGANVRFSKQRKGYESSLSVLRKQWAEQRLQQEAQERAQTDAAK